MKSTHNMVRGRTGYTLVEMMMVVGLLGVLTSMAVLQMAASRPGMIGDAGMRVIMSELNSARENAIAQRRTMVITFGASSIRVTRNNFPVGTTILRDVPLESGLRFGILAGSSDTPDAFGNGAATSFGGAATIMFNTDGALIDLTGAPVNGSVFILFPGLAQSYRAVTVLGATGRVRGYRWTGARWTRV